MDETTTKKVWCTEKDVELRIASLQSGADLQKAFEDPDFPAGPESLGASMYTLTTQQCSAGVFQNDEVFEWHSLYTMCNGKPELFVDGAEMDDVVAGELNDGWFLTALSLIAGRGSLLRWLFVDYLSAPLHGLYTIQFFVDGEWRYVMVDDRMPCCPGTHDPVRD